MATDVDKALASAKSALASAKKFTASTGDSDPSRFAPKSASAPSAPAKKPESGLIREASDVASGIKYRTDQAKALGSMKKGGTIPKTGNYKMHKDEEVVTADKSNLQDVIERAKDSLGGPKRPKHGMRSSHVDHLNDGSHVVRMQPHAGDEVNFSAKDHQELASKLKEYLGGDEMAEGDNKKDSPAEESKEKV